MKFSCKDLSGGECNHVIDAATAQEARGKAMEHAKKVHKDLLKKMSPQQLEHLMKKIDDLYKKKPK